VAQAVSYARVVNVHAVTVRPAACACFTISGRPSSSRFEGAIPVANDAISASPSRESHRIAVFRLDEQHARKLRQLPRDIPKRSIVERLHDDRPWRAGVEPKPRDRFDEERRLIDAARPIERWCLQLRVQSRGRSHRGDRFLPGRDAFTRERWVEPCAGIELLDLGQREVDRHPSLLAGLWIGDTAIGKHGGRVRRALERVVVQADQRVVPGDRQVLLDVVGALPYGELVRRERVFRARKQTRPDVRRAASREPVVSVRHE
jgi:hypothetical protein